MKRREKVHLSTEEQGFIKRRACMQLRALVREVTEHADWLGVTEHSLGENVNKNIALLIRTKTAAGEMSQLTLEHKALLRKPAALRTKEEKVKLFKLAGGLKCFKRYPKKVQRRLSAVTYYLYYRADRWLVRQDDDADALYLILSGEVIIIQSRWDPKTNTTLEEEIGTMGSGDAFGELAILHQKIHLAGCKTLVECELLCVSKEDFQVVLFETVQKSWNQIRKAMYSFSYFATWEEDAVRECCIMSKVRSFDAMHTIIGHGKGSSDHVYFLLNGSVRLIENFKVEVTIDVLGRKHYKKYKETPGNSSNVNLRNIAQAIRKSRTDIQKRITQIFDEAIKLGIRMSAMKETSEQFVNGIRVMAEDTDDEYESDGKYELNDLDEYDDDDIDDLEKIVTVHNARNIDVQEAAELKAESVNEEGSFTDDQILWTNKSEIDLSKKSTAIDLFENKTHRYNYLKNAGAKKSRDKTFIKTYFYEVCVMHEGSCFGLGEDLTNRALVTNTPVVCLLVPRYWLLQHKPEMWAKVAHYINTYVPKSEEVFKHFVRQRKWMEYKTNLVHSIVSKKPRRTTTTIHDVPYSIRLQEDLNFY